jgi:hypothetical protein
MRHTWWAETVLLISVSATAGTVVLNRKWVEDNKKSATIRVGFIVDHAHPHPNSAKNDGDIHASGRSKKDVGLPMVAEVMNAAGPGGNAMNQVHAVEGKGTEANVTGAWRLWFEHPATRQVQFQRVPVPTNTNPDHSFEIHPIVCIDRVGAGQAFQDIPGFQKKKAEDAFGAYEKQSITVAANPTAVALTAKKVGFNYVEFRFTALGTPTALVDNGRSVSASVEGVDSDEELGSQVPMIFVPGTKPCNIIGCPEPKTDKCTSGLKPAKKTITIVRGTQMHVIGIPRVSLNAISKFIAAQSGTQQATRKLPYEMIIVAVLDK